MSPEFICAIFTVMYVCVCVPVSVCVYVSNHDSVKRAHSFEFKFGRSPSIGPRRTSVIDFSEYRMNSFLQEHKKEFLYIMASGVKFFNVF